MDRRGFIKKGISRLALTFAGGALLSSYSRRAEAEPIKIIVDAMGYAWGLMLDAAVEMIERAMTGQQGSSDARDLTAFARAGDSINTTMATITKNRVVAKSLPAPGLCDFVEEDRRSVEAVKQGCFGIEREDIMDRVVRSIHQGRRFHHSNGEWTDSTGMGGSPAEQGQKLTEALLKPQESEIRLSDLMVEPLYGADVATPDERESTKRESEQKIARTVRGNAARAGLAEIDDVFLNREQLKAAIDTTYHSEQWRQEVNSHAEAEPLAQSLIRQLIVSCELELGKLHAEERALMLQSLDLMGRAQRNE